MASLGVAALELRWVGDPYGQLGVTPVVLELQSCPFRAQRDLVGDRLDGGRS